MNTRSVTLLLLLAVSQTGCGSKPAPVAQPATKQVNPNLKERIPALIALLQKEDIDFDTAIASMKELGSLGPDAIEAVPLLTKIRDQNAKVNSPYTRVDEAAAKDRKDWDALEKIRRSRGFYQAACDALVQIERDKN